MGYRKILPRGALPRTIAPSFEVNMRKRQLIIVCATLAVSLAQSPPTDVVEETAQAPVHLRHIGDVRAICRVGDSLWVGTGGGMFIYDLGSDVMADRITLGKRLPSNSVRSISARGDSVFVGTDDGLSVFTPDSVYVFTDRRPGAVAGVPLEMIRA